MASYNFDYLSTIEHSPPADDLQRFQNAHKHAWFQIFRICTFTLHILALLAAYYWYHLDLRYLPISCIVALIPITQVIAFHPEIVSKRLNNFSRQNGYPLILLTDTIILSILLALSGGPMNPFSIGYLVFVVIAAVTLNENWVWIISSATLVGFIAISYFHIPLHQLLHHSDVGLSLHLKGMLIAYAFTALILSLFLRRIVKEHTDLREQYLQLKSSLEKLASVTTITADTVHQLRTPLATMKLIVDELSFHYSSTLKNISATYPVTTNVYKRHEPIEDIILLSEQIVACNTLLTNMCYQNGNIHGAEFSELKINTIWQDACTDLEGDQLKIIEISPSDSTLVAPRIPLVRALRGVVMNAIQAVSDRTDGNQGKVHLSAELGKSEITFVISDNGPGMDAKVRSMCHHPFFTTKKNGTSIGLGLFVANTVALQLGGTLTIDSTKGKGTLVSITVPRNIPCKSTF